MQDGWEYHTEVFDFRRWNSAGHFDGEAFTSRANTLGWEGWELVNSMDTNFNQGATFWIVAVFKRKLTPERRAQIHKELST
jgi:hypothetical protein